MTIQIEICKGWKKGTWKIRIGDIQGSTELCNVSKKEILEEILGAMNEYTNKENSK